MAKVHFAKDGVTAEGEVRTQSVDISSEKLEALFSGHDFRFSKNPPRFNHNKVVNEYGPYQHVVLEIEEGESTSTFQKTGYYFLPSLTVAKYKKLMGEA